MKLIVLTTALLALGACSHLPTDPRSGPTPTVSFQTNPENSPGYVSPCAGGMPQMHYNCPLN